MTLKCYDCNSMSKRDCDDPFDPPDREPLASEYISDCGRDLQRQLAENLLPSYTPPPPTANATAVCRKIIQMSKYQRFREVTEKIGHC